MKKPFAIILLSITTAMFCIHPTFADITIIVNPGPFESIAKAAIAEKQVNWSDGDFTDDSACTECFAATELAQFLIKSGAAEKDEIKLQPPKKCPQKAISFYSAAAIQTH